MRKTKIVCTIGPAIESEEMLIKMMEAGMNVARLNFSHESQEVHEKRIQLIREAAKKANKHIAIMLDTKGPEIRCGKFENGSVTYKRNDIVKLVKEEVLGNSERFHVNCKELFDDIKDGEILLIDDGNISLRVLEHKKDEILVKFLNGGTIKDKKGINAPNIKLSMPFISQRDYEDLKFGCEHDVDIIALSFVRRKEDVLLVRDVLKSFNKADIEVISKIENQEGIDNLEDIIKVSDGIMVARGDLGVEVPTEKVPVYQKRMISMTNDAGKAVITATQMLESMINNPRPTRAEANDVANAIFDGSDAIMLSGESAIGKYPVKAVEYMNKIALEVEKEFDYRKGLSNSIKSSQKTKNDAIGISVAECCLTLENVSAIFAFTETGGTAKRIGKFRPCAPIIACSNNLKACRKLAYYYGIYPVYADYVEDLNKWDEEAQRVAKIMNLPTGSTIILTSGFGQKHGSTNTIRIIEVK